MVAVAPTVVYKEGCFVKSGSDHFVKSSASDYGTIKVQTIIDKWPDGEVLEDSNGVTKAFLSNTYDGYMQNRIADSIDFSALDTPAKVARWAAPAVVQVYGDTCMLNQNGFIDWRFSSSPRTGFFIALGSYYYRGQRDGNV